MQTTLCLCCNVWVGKSLETPVRTNKAAFKYKQKYMKTLVCLTVIFNSVLTCFTTRFEEWVYSAVLWSLKDKASRIERIVGEHRLFSQGLKELQDWVCEAQRVLNTCISATTDKSVLEDRMLQLEVRRDKMDVGSLKGIHHSFQRLGYWSTSDTNNYPCFPSNTFLPVWHFQWF